jgi:uncharacterized zinc-type alcohol dehydrogenase-like protein
MPASLRAYILPGRPARPSIQQPCKDEPLKTSGYAATDANVPLQPFSFERRALRPGDVGIDILYCGVCHTDLHMMRNDWGFSVYPLVPGHEIVGRVSSIGSGVSRFKVGDNVAIGTMVDSCLECDQCRRNEEQILQGNFPNGSTIKAFAGSDRLSFKLRDGAEKAAA